MRRRHVGEGCGAPDRVDEHGQLRLSTVGSLEDHGVIGPESQHHPSRPGTRERRRGSVADDVPGVDRVVQPQGEAQVGVRPDVVADDPGRPLRRQDEVDAEAASALGDADERRHERGDVGGQGGELVDDDDESRQGGPAGDGPVLGEIGGADRTEQALPPAQLGLQTGQRPFGQAVVEVGHQPDGVRQIGAGVERRPALVVDEDEREVRRAAAGGERDDERPQQLALPRASRAGDEGVGPVADEIDLDDAVGGEAERRDRARVRPVGAPCGGDGDGVVDRAGAVVRAELAEADRDRQCAGGRVRVLRVVQPGQRAGDRRRRGDRRPCCVHDVDAGGEGCIGRPAGQPDRPDVEHAAAHRRHRLTRRHSRHHGDRAARYRGTGATSRCAGRAGQGDR